MKTTKEKIAEAICIADGCDPDAIGYAVTDKTEEELGKSYPLWKYRVKQAQAALDVVLAELENGKISDGYHTLNELYEHRHALFACLWTELNGWKSKKHADGTMFDGWFVAGIDLPHGSITYHIPLRLWDLFKSNELSFAPEWDGHTSDDVINRLKAAADMLRG